MSNLRWSFTLRILLNSFICIFLLGRFVDAQLTHAFTITEDPQYVVMNFSTINELNWAAPQDEWQQKIKPQILAQISELKKALPLGADQRKLAWSTLQEYMNTPLDNPSDQSVYVIKLKRILEIAEEENLPVFLPFNGFQWWDELPELYNWWDPDGTHTPEIFFARQKTVDFKDRFIKGYNPDNQWNVEWQSYVQPMNLNWRNWGGGGFRLAPPPNLVENHRAATSYRQVQAARLKILLQTLANQLERWQQTNKAYLFAGLSIGTEISLNASVTPKDEFMPYGYRGIQDELCPSHEATCGAQLNFNHAQQAIARQAVVAKYLNDLSRMAVNLGIPKQRIYTHVWSEAEPHDARYSNYAAATMNYYARPGISLYGYADKPFALTDWKKMMTDQGWPAWGAVEYSVPKTKVAGIKALESVLDSSLASAKIVTLYNWSEHQNTPAITAITAILQQPPLVKTCLLPEIIPLTENYADTPSTLNWQYFGDEIKRPTEMQLQLHIQNGILVAPPVATASANQDAHSVALTSFQTQQTDLPLLSVGVYTWYLELRGCPDNQKQFSEPRIMTISHRDKK